MVKLINIVANVYKPNVINTFAPPNAPTVTTVTIHIPVVFNFGFGGVYNFISAAPPLVLWLDPSDLSTFTLS